MKLKLKHGGIMNMKKSIIRLLLIVAFVISVFLVNACCVFAVDNTNYSGYVLPHAMYKTQGMVPPIYGEKSGKENISTVTGSLTISETDLTLKGKNGLDLNLTRIYDLSQSALGEPYARSTLDTSINLTGTYNQKYFDIGAGWSFNFPFIEVKDGWLYLHYGNEGVWPLSPTANSQGFLPLEGYNLNDIKVKYDLTYSVNGVRSVFLLEDKFGKKVYFDEDGKVISIKDRFGNEIKFHYVARNGNRYISKIIDSLQREVNFNYIDNNTTHQLVVTVQDGGTTRSIYYNKTRAVDLGVITSPSVCVLGSVVDVAGKTTTYTYDLMQNAPVSFFRTSNHEAFNIYACLKEITYPTLGKTCYDYESYMKNCGPTGSMRSYRVVARYEKLKNATIRNYKSYSYDNYFTEGSITISNLAYEGYPSFCTYNKDHTIPTTFTIKTTITDSLGNTEVFKHDKDMLCTSVIREGTTFKYETTNKYDSNKLLTKIINKIYNKQTGQYISKMEDFTYDSNLYRDLVSYYGPNASREPFYDLPNDDKDRILYTYNQTYHYVTSKDYYINTNDRHIIEQYTPSSDQKTIQYERVLENYTLQKKTKFEYDSYGNIIRETCYLDDGTYDWSSDTDAIITNYSYTDASRPNFNGGYLTRKWVDNVYDVNNVLVTARAGNNAGTIDELYVYDGFGNLIEIQDGNGNITSYEYDEYNRLTKEIYPDNNYKEWDYELTSTENYIISTDENGNKKKLIFDELGNVVLEQVYVKNEVTGVYEYRDLNMYAYDSMSRLDWEENLESGAKTDYTYFNDGRLQQKDIIETDNNNELIYSEVYTYTDACTDSVSGKNYSLITKVVKGNSQSNDITTRSYINAGGYTEIQESIHNGQAYRNTFEYDRRGNLIREKNARANANNWTYSALYDYTYSGKLRKYTNIAGDYTTTEYDELGRVKSVTDFNGNKASIVYSKKYIYDKCGRLIMEKTPYEAIIGTPYFNYSNKLIYYDRNGNIVKEMTSNNAINQTSDYTKVEYEYNNRNFLVKVTNYSTDSTKIYTQYYYDNAGNKIRMYTGLSSPITITGLDTLTNVTDSVYSTTKYDYNELNNLIQLTDPLGKNETYAYDLNGNLISKTDRNGNIISFTYDGLNRLLTRSTGNTSYSYTYDLTGNRLSMNGGGTSVSYQYDDLGRLINETESNNIEKTYTYDENNNRTSFVIKQNNIIKTNTTYTYDNMDRLSTVSEGGQLLATYGYDSNGNRTSLTYSNGNSTIYTYNLANKVTELKNLNNNSTPPELSDFVYTYYLSGNIESKTDIVTGKSTNYSYDKMGRLRTEMEKLNGTTISTIDYFYNDYNNRIIMYSESGGIQTTTQYSYDAANKLITETKTCGSTSTVTSYGYDDNGNQLTVTVNNVVTSTNTYDGFNQLTSTVIDNKTNTYSYNADGLRTSKSVNGVVTNHILDGQNVALETDGSGNVISKYIRGINLIAFDDITGVNVVRKFYLFNAHGDVVHLTDSTGSVVKEYQYDAFGNRILPKYGDVNGDGSITETDKLLISAYILGQIDEFPSKDGFIAGDLDGNGYITSTDRAFIDRYLLGMITYFDRVDKNLDGYPQDNETHANYSDANVFRYCGEYFDKETGTIYLRARYYDPATSRMLSEDSYWGDIRDPLSLNLYTYCKNDPVNRIDPSGHDSYVYYDPSDHGFTKQAEAEAKRLEKQYGTPVHLVGITTTEQFKENWNGMGSYKDKDGNTITVSIEGVSLLFHGSPHTLNIDYTKDQYLTTSSDGKTPGGRPALYIGDLESKTFDKLTILSCNGGHIDHLDDNVAVTFLNSNNVKKVIAWDGSVSYSKTWVLWGSYYPRLAYDQSAYYSWTPDSKFLWFTFKRAPLGEITYTKDENGNINWDFKVQY